MDTSLPSTTATFLGTGTSIGVPVIGCECAVCRSTHPGDKRTRSSLHVQHGDTSILIDSGPDLRAQALRENLTKVDAVLYTHSHLDHIAGFDELRAFCWRREAPLPLYAGPQTHADLRRMYPWAFEHNFQGYVRPDPIIFDTAFPLGALTITPVPVEHATVETYGFRFDLPSGHSFAYISDVKRIPPSSASLLQDLDLLIIDALRPNDHPTHMTIAEALATTRDLQAREAIFTHLAHEIGYEAESAKLPTKIRLARDGLRLLFQPDQSCAMVEPTAVPLE